LGADRHWWEGRQTLIGEEADTSGREADTGRTEADTGGREADTGGRKGRHW